jgi:hypothetical protein
MAQLFDVFLKNDLHVVSLSSYIHLPEQALSLRGLGCSDWGSRDGCGYWRSGSCGCTRRSVRGLRNDLARGLRAGGAACERQQGDIARALDGDAEPALVARANSGHAARQNFAAFLDELRKNVGALVVHEVHLLDTKLADFLFAEILALAAWTAAGPAWATAARSAFAARTTVPAAGAAMTTTTFSARRSTVRLCLFRILCHCCLPFSLRTGKTKFEKRNSKMET